MQYQSLINMVRFLRTKATDEFSLRVAMMQIRSVVSVGLFSLVALAAQGVSAAPILCSDNTDGSTTTNPDGLSTSDVTFDIPPDPTPPGTPADDCYGVVSGNTTDSASDVDHVGGDPWSFIAKDAEDTVGELDGIQFTLDAELGTNQGDWTVTWEDINGPDPLNFPVTVDFAVALKATNAYAVYYFYDIELLADPNTGGGTFSVRFNPNPQEIFPDLSHMSLYARALDDDGGPSSQVPEPAMLGLLGLGALAAAVVRRRKR
jgi:hypothetical protein